jgi:hypothetical protein
MFYQWDIEVSLRPLKNAPIFNADDEDIKIYLSSVVDFK